MEDKIRDIGIRIEKLKTRSGNDNIIRKLKRQLRKLKGEN